MFAKTIKTVSLSVLALSIFVACTDDDNPVVQPTPQATDSMFCAIDSSFATTQDSAVYEVAVNGAQEVAVYWKELGTTEPGNDKTADIQGSVLLLDGVTPYVIVDNQKPFLNKDKSAWDNAKTVLIDKGETSIKIKLKPYASNPIVGTYAIYVKKIK